jgi:hypothetical protein
MIVGRAGEDTDHHDAALVDVDDLGDSRLGVFGAHDNERSDPNVHPRGGGPDPV